MKNKVLFLLITLISLQNLFAQQSDSQEWEYALKVKTVEGFEKYLDNPKNKLHEEEANKYLEFMEIESFDNREDDKEILTQFYSNIPYYVNLKKISLFGENGDEEEKVEEALIDLPSNFGELTKLEEIEIYFGVNKLPNSVKKLKNLKSLKLYYCNYKEVPIVISNLKKLEILSFSGNDLKVIPNWIDQLTELKKLDFSMNKLKSVPSTLKNLKKLEVFESLAIYLQDFPIVLTECTSLKKLKLSHIAYKSPFSQNIPIEIGNLVNLEELELTGSLIKNIPSSIENLQKLKILKLDFSDDNSLPKSFSNLSSLEELKMSSYVQKNKSSMKVLKKLQKRNENLKIEF